MFAIDAARHTFSAAEGDGLLGDGTPVDLPFGLTVQSTALLEGLVVAAVLGVWFLLLAAVLASTRPADVDPLPAGADLPGDEPPAVVSLFAGRWRLNEDAAESTLLDLAARHWIELRQPGNDPTHTTVHLIRHPAGRPPGEHQPLTTYEQLVLDRVRSEAVDDVVPITALTFRDQGEAHQWTSRLHHAVIEDARARGLTRRRVSPLLVSLLSAAAVVPAVLIALVMMERSGEFDGAPGAGIVAWGVLSALAGRPLGERDTPAGREAAARWFGLRTFLRNDEVFAELPPSAVAVWDRYLSYGDALGVTRVSSALMDLGMGDRKRVWSSFGGSWHRVRVRYPKFWGRYGATVLRVLVGAAGVLVAGVFILRTFGSTGVERPDTGLALLGDLPFLLGLYLVVRGLYRLARLAADLLAPRSLAGEVLWVELWKSTAKKENRPSRPLVHYFAVDDGTGDRTTAWALPSEWSGQARPGDLVTIRVRPWTRRVTEMTVDSRSARPAEVAAGAVPPVVAAAAVASAVTSAQGAGAPAVGGLLSAEEVSVALGRPVASDGAAARITLGPFELLTFADPGSSDPVLVMAVARGSAVGLVTGAARHAGTDLPDLGDEAWQGPDWVLARRGDTVVRLNLQTTPDASDALPALLARALSRLP